MMTKKNDWLIIATGSNLGDKVFYLEQAKNELKKILSFKAESQIFTSSAIGYTDQPDFYNQVLEFKIPIFTPDQVMQMLLDLEKKMGRTREIFQGPRTIDLDILFWGTEKHLTDLVQIPHPRWHERNFVVQPLKQLPSFQSLKKYFNIPHTLSNDARPI